MTTTVSPQRNSTVDFLRAFCILYIVAYWHLFNYTNAFPGYANLITENLKVIVLGIFVFISGFLLASKKISLTSQGLWTFYQRRLIRVYPLYLLSLMAFAVEDPSKIAVFAKAAFLISMFYPPAPNTLWFITMIMFFYLIVPFLIRFADRAIEFSLFVITLLIAFSCFNEFINPLDNRIILYFPAFSLGIFFRQQKTFQEACYKNKLALIGCFIASCFISLIETDAPILEALVMIPLMLTGTLTVFVYTDQLLKKKSLPALVYLVSYASFCMYLFHRLIFSVTIEIFFPANEMMQVVYLLCCAVPLTVIFSWVIQKLYDDGMPMINKVAQRQ